MRAVNRLQPADAPTLFPLEAPGLYAGIVLNRPVEQLWSYRVPDDLRSRIALGARVRVPLGRGNSLAIGYCVALQDQLPDGLPESRVKDLVEVVDQPPLIDGSLLELTRWLARYYACSWGQSLDAVLPAGVKRAAGSRISTCLVVPEEVRSAPIPDLPPKQAEVLDFLRQHPELLTVADVCRLVRCSPAPIEALRGRGLLHTVRKRIDRPIGDPDPKAGLSQPTTLEPTAEQADALSRMIPALEKPSFSTFVLHGVTGSGKTEVYLNAIEHTVALGREAIVLVPEISLTPQTIRRFRRRFPRVAVLHSHLSDSERHRHWKAIASGQVQVVVGVRSAIFAPTRKLGLIIIDEEHEPSFKQETVPRYHARDVAVKRAQLLGIPIILGSATPSLETYQNCLTGRYSRLNLTSRVLDRPMPPVEIIDLRYEKPSKQNPIGGLSARLRDAMEQALGDGGQVILLLNRRGFHTFILCPSCGHVLKCKACDVALTHHKGRKRAICHACDAEREPPDHCPSCNKPSLHYGGIGTERLEREVRAAFPSATIERMDSDTMRSPGSHERVLQAFKDGDTQILLGTQMIAKGLDFPNVLLVGVVTADTAIHLPDFRAAERTFQLVAQVAGRTGRGERPGRVIVQTYCPEHPAILCAARHDYVSFADEELMFRSQHHVPPYGRLIRLVARGETEKPPMDFLSRLAGQIKAQASRVPGFHLLGPAPAPISKLQSHYRFHLRLFSSSPGSLQEMLHSLLPSCTPPTSVDLSIDVDPVNML